jgi:predicted metal-dependent HD superfamily phosphohydrolase
MQHEDFCRSAWLAVTELLDLSEPLTERWWRILVDFFREEQRHYHTFEHIHELLKLSEMHKSLISNYSAIMMSIFFHDIVYNPRSSSNEDDSNDIFLQFVIDCNNPIVSRLSNTVFAMIEMTKNHQIPVNADFDMQFFSDIDMGILGSNMTRYQQYAGQIRLEYNFVEFKTFCTKRSAFLQSCLSSGQPMFATKMFQDERGEQVLINIAWEYNLLKLFQCPVEALALQSSNTLVEKCKKFPLSLHLLATAAFVFLKDS